MGFRQRIKESKEHTMPTQENNPEDLSMNDLAWAAFYLGGKFSKYSYRELKRLDEAKYYEAQYYWFLIRDNHFEEQREKDGPWLGLIKDIKTAFINFWTHIRE